MKATFIATVHQPVFKHNRKWHFSTSICDSRTNGIIVETLPCCRQITLLMECCVEIWSVSILFPFTAATKEGSKICPLIIINSVYSVFIIHHWDLRQLVSSSAASTSYVANNPHAVHSSAVSRNISPFTASSEQLKSNWSEKWTLLSSFSFYFFPCISSGPFIIWKTKSLLNRDAESHPAGTILQYSQANLWVSISFIKYQ